METSRQKISPQEALNSRLNYSYIMIKNKDELVFIIDDDESVRRSLALFLTASGYQVELMGSSEEYLARKVHEGTGCLVLDVHFHGKSGLELQNELLGLNSHLPIIFITGQGNIPMSVDALKHGAINFLEKPFDQEALLHSISEAIELSKKLKAEKEETLKCQLLMDALTPREYQILTLLITGMLNKQIAGELDIAEHTVKLHRHSICEKLAVKSVPELIRIAEKSGRLPSLNK